MRDLALDALACFRITRLVTADVLTQAARGRFIAAAYEAAGRREDNAPPEDYPASTSWWDEVVQRDGDPPKLATLATCPWCASMYVAVAVVLARRVAPRAWGPLAKVLALSAASGIIASAAE